MRGDDIGTREKNGERERKTEKEFEEASVTVNTICQRWRWGGWVIPSVFLENCHSEKDRGERELEEGKHDHEKVIPPSGNRTNYHLFFLVSCFERSCLLISVSPRPQQQV